MVVLDLNMRLQDLLYFAATLADEYRTIQHRGHRLNERALQRYWVSSQARFNLWGGKLRLATDQLTVTDFRGQRFWTAWSPVFQELLVSDVTTRLWASLLHALDERLGLCEYSPIGRSVLRGHDDARQRVVNLVLKGRKRGNSEAIRLESLQRGLERWSDLLLAHASQDPDSAAYSHDPKRYSHYVSLCQEGEVRRLLAFRTALDATLRNTAIIPAHVDLHLQLHAQILAALDTETKPALRADFDVTWQARIISLTDEVSVMIDRWLDPALVADPPVDSASSPTD